LTDEGREGRKAPARIHFEGREGELSPVIPGDGGLARGSSRQGQDRGGPSTRSSFGGGSGPSQGATTFDFGVRSRSHSPRYSRYPLYPQSSPRSPELRRGPDHPPTVGRYAVGGRPPRLTDGIILAERVHAALVELSDGSSTFTGCDEAGKPLAGHGHAYVLPESVEALGRGRGGEVTHLTVYAPAGFGSREIGALEALREVGGSGLDLQLTLLGLGQPESFGGSEAAGGASPLLAESRTWVSRTPFIPTRYPKATRAGAPKLDPAGRQIGSPEHELRRLLGLAGFPEPAAVEPVSSTEIAGERVEWASFRRARNSGAGRRAGSAGYGFRIEFAEAVRGPVVVGYGAHFGMGGFVAGDSNIRYWGHKIE